MDSHQLTTHFFSFQKIIKNFQMKLYGPWPFNFLTLQKKFISFFLTSLLLSLFASVTIITNHALLTRSMSDTESKNNIYIFL